MNSNKELMFKSVIETLERKGTLSFKELKEEEPIKTHIDKNIYTSNSLIATLSSSKYNNTDNTETCLFEKTETKQGVKVVKLRQNYKQVKLYNDLYNKKENN